jgi:MtrB/PioB family decaheme-associated outer membrane protein
MSTPPGNDLHQINVSGGYTLLAKTRLAGNLSYARNTQNQGYAVDAFMLVPASTAAGNALASPNALVVNTHADLKLTDQTIRNLALTAGLRYDLRDNRTASNIYNFFAIDGAHPANYPNTPLSIRKTQLELAGDYRIRKDQNLRLAYIHDDTSRWCGQYAVNAGYPAGTNCVVARSAREDKVEATYRIKAYESLNLRVGYAYSKRTTAFDTDARAAFLSVNGGAAGQNAGDFPGFHPFLDANRKQHAFKASASWEVNEMLSVGLGGRFTGDTYDTQYGIQNGNTWSLNLDSALRYSENGTLTAYATQQHMERTMTDLQRSPTAALLPAGPAAVAVPGGANWTDKLKNDDLTLGVGVRHAGLMAGKLELAGDASYSWSRSQYDNQLNYATTTTLGASCSAPNILSCGSTPDIKINIIQFKFSAIYQVDKQSKVALRYLSQHFAGEDYYYNGYQLGFTPTALMPTNQQIGNHHVNVISASYIHSF